MSAHLFPYRWSLADGYPAKGITYHGRKVFGTFICGGGSTMGYKLAGYHHLGGVGRLASVGATRLGSLSMAPALYHGYRGHGDL